MKILIVEDEKDLSAIFSRFLSGQGHPCSNALSLAEASLKATQEGPFDAAILDLYLPDGNGLDLLPWLKHKNPGIWVVVVSGTGDSQAQARALAAGADRFLPKPTSLKELLDRVLEGASGQRKEA